MSVAAVEHYREEFTRYQDTLAGDRFSETRQAAMMNLEQKGFPTLRHENWKYTDIRPVIRTAFTLPTDRSETITPEEIASFRPHGLACHELVFINGIYNDSLSSIQDLPDGVVIGNLEKAKGKYDKLMEHHLTRYADTENNPFVALNTAFLNHGAFIFVPENISLEKPVHLLFIASTGDDEHVSYPRILVIMEENSNAMIIENYCCMENNHYFTDTVTEISLQENSRLEHFKIQQESSNSYHIGNLHAGQQSNSSFQSHSISLGGSITRNDIYAELRAEGAEILLNGLYIANEKQHMDNHTRVDHLKAHTTSHEYYRGVVNHMARAVFNGKVIVHKDAQKTDALQSNANLLLSDTAEVDTKPELEIYADDVKCSHGATVGQLDEDMLYYLRTRAIDEETAKGLLTCAFANEIMDRIKSQSLRQYLEQQVLGKLPDADRVRELD